MTENCKIPLTSHHLIETDGMRVFYREAGPADAPVVLLLHGFPTSSFQYRELIPRLADRYRVIAPDLPGFGFTEVPASGNYRYTFDALARTILAFTQALRLTRFAMYVFDYGAPTGFRLALLAPERVAAIISQNGNAYQEGLGGAWQPIQRYWNEPTMEHRNAIRQGLTLETFIRDGLVTFWHQSGTAKMGNDALSVVDGALKVVGLNRLRIADASVLPKVTTGNTMAPCVVIGEQAADMLTAACGNPA